MKKLALLSVLLVASTGCAGGILDRLIHGDVFYGDSCGSCGYKLPAAPSCNNCNTVGSGYGAYEGEIVTDPYYNGPIVVDSGTTTAPPLNALPANP